MHDHCTKTSTDSSEFKPVHVESGPLKFDYILCNEHVEELVQRQAGKESGETK